LYLGNVFRFACYPLAISDPCWIFSGARHKRDLFGLFDSFDFLPGVSYLFVRINCAAQVVEQEGVGLPVFCVAASAMFYKNDVESIKGTQGSRHTAPLNAIINELLGSDDQFAVLITAMMPKLYLNARKRQMLSFREYAKGTYSCSYWWARFMFQDIYGILPRDQDLGAPREPSDVILEWISKRPKPPNKPMTCAP
jgi:hypothetical protein